MWRENADTGEHVIPTLVLTAEEAARHADLNMAYATYCNEVVQKIVAGQMSIDEWDDCVDYIYQLGLEEDLAILNAAYQRYLNQGK
jgi:GH24 family phage-related lysozyme (muramidase)